MRFDEIHNHCKCCMCDGPLNKNFALAQIPVTINWDYPQFGNIITGTHHIGAATVCETCENKEIENFKYVIEIQPDNKVIYHSIVWNNGSPELQEP